MRILSYVLVFLVGGVIGFILHRGKPDYIIQKPVIKVNMHPKIAEIRTNPVPVTLVEKRSTVIKRLVDTLYLPTDTDAIIKDYLTERLYDDTLRNDTVAFVRIKSRVYGNRLIDISLFYQNRVKTSIIKKIPAPKYYVGAGIMISSDPGVGLEGGYAYKRSLFTVGMYSNASFTFSWKYGFH